MDYVISLLEGEKKHLETDLRARDLMHQNMKQAALHMKYINELKRAIKVLHAKSKF